MPMVCLQVIMLFNSTFWWCLRILISICRPAMIESSLSINWSPITGQKRLSDTSESLRSLRL